MKKLVMILTLATVATIALAAPVTVTFIASGTAAVMYDHDGIALQTDALASGSYAELIIKQGSSYNPGANIYDTSWTVLGSLSQDNGATYTLPSVVVGKSVTGGTTFGNGKIGFKWVNTSYNTSYYVAIRFFDAATKGGATFYGVTGPLQLTKAGSTDGSSTTESKTWSANTTSTNNRYYAQYAVPEPTTMALFGLGGLAIMIRRKMKKEA